MIDHLIRENFKFTNNLKNEPVSIWMVLESYLVNDYRTPFADALAPLNKFGISMLVAIDGVSNLQDKYPPGCKIDLWALMNRASRVMKSRSRCIYLTLDTVCKVQEFDKRIIYPSARQKKAIGPPKTITDLQTWNLGFIDRDTLYDWIT